MNEQVAANPLGTERVGKLMIRGLIQDQDRRVRNGGAGDGEELPLALAQIGPIAGEDCLV